jgi:hypothetical protein
MALQLLGDSEEDNGSEGVGPFVEKGSRVHGSTINLLSNQIGARRHKAVLKLKLVKFSRPITVQHLKLRVEMIRAALITGLDTRGN